MMIAMLKWWRVVVAEQTDGVEAAGAEEKMMGREVQPQARRPDRE